MTGYLIVSCIDLFVSMYVLSVSRKQTATAFALLWSCAAIWTFNLYLATSTIDLAQYQLWFHILRLGMFSIAPCILFFFLTVTRTPIVGAWKGILTLSGIASLSIYLANNLVFPSVLEHDGTGYSSQSDLISFVHEINFVSVSFLTVFLTASAYRRAIYREKLRIKWLLVALFIACTLGVLSFEHSKLYGMAGNIIGLLLMAYATLKHHVTGIGTTIRTGFIKLGPVALLSLALFGCYYCSVRFDLPRSETFILTGATVAFFMVIQGRLQQFIERAADHLLPSRIFNLDGAKNRTLKILSSATSIDQLKQMLDEIFDHLIPIKTFTVVLKGTDPHISTPRVALASQMVKDPALSQLLLKLFSYTETRGQTVFYDDTPPEIHHIFTQEQVSACVPITCAAGTEGFLVLGQPTSAEEFSHNDVLFLDWLGKTLAKPLKVLTALTDLEKSLSEAEKTLSLVDQLNAYNHDVKTPFSNIEALVLSGDAFSDEERQGHILEQARKGKQLVAVMTRMLHGHHQDHRSLVDLNDLVHEVVNAFPTKRDQVCTDLTTCPLISVIEDEIRILLFNLLTNAFESGSDTHLKVHVSTHYDQGTGSITCMVKDNGAGMEQSVVQNLWNKPYSSKRKKGGSGVGLSVAKRIADRNNGMISIDSRIGQGTAVTFAFPTATINNTVASRV